MAVDEQVDPRLRGFTAHVRGYAILTLDARGRVRTWNDGARLVKGYTAEEIVGSPYERFFPREDAAAGRPAEVLRMAREKGQHEEEGWRVRKDGTQFWAHISITPITGDAGELVGYGKITEDLTERRAQEEAMHERMEELARSNAELEQFAYVTSHDLSEPLRSITGYADVLRRRYEADLDANGQRYLDKILMSSTRMRSLIDDLLAYSRAGRRGLETGAVDIGEVVTEALEQLAAAITESEATVTVGDLPTLHGDRTLLAQVISNLIANALKFSEGAPEVEVTGAERGDGFEIVIADRGIGIEPEYFDRIFELFQRLHTRDQYQGTGVGLAISRRITERHGGELHAEARPGGGTVFRLVLPRTVPEKDPT